MGPLQGRGGGTEVGRAADKRRMWLTSGPDARRDPETSLPPQHHRRPTVTAGGEGLHSPGPRGRETSRSCPGERSSPWSCTWPPPVSAGSLIDGPSFDRNVLEGSCSHLPPCCRAGDSLVLLPDDPRHEPQEGLGAGRLPGSAAAQKSHRLPHSRPSHPTIFLNQ